MSQLQFEPGYPIVLPIFLHLFDSKWPAMLCQEGSEGHLVNRLGWKNGQNNMMIRNGRMLRITEQFLQGYHTSIALQLIQFFQGGQIQQQGS